MNNDINIKIIGEDTLNLFLAFLLLKKGFKVKIIKNSNVTKKIRQEKIFFISHSIKSFLDNFNLWHQLKDKAYTIESLTLLDMSISQKIDISFRDFNLSKPNPNNIGWIVSQSDLNDILLNEISNFNNVFSELNIKLNSEIKDSEVNLLGLLTEKFKKRFLIPFLIKSNNPSVEFNAFLRGYTDYRHYSIISENGLIFLCPIYKNLFNVKWFINKSTLERTKSFENALLLDNLSTILPNQLKIDQIFDNIKVTPIYPEMFKRISENDNYLIIKKGSVNLLDFGLEGINLSFKDVIYIYNSIKNLDFYNKKKYGFFRFKFLILKYFKLRIFAIFNQLFIKNNYFLYFLKRIIFCNFKKLKIFKNFVFNFINKSL